MSNISAGIGRGQMEVLDKHIGLRQDMNRFFKKLFQEMPSITLWKESNADFISNHWLSAVLITP